MNFKIVLGSLYAGILCVSSSSNVLAALSSNAVLVFNAGKSPSSPGAPDGCQATGQLTDPAGRGSCFGMELFTGVFVPTIIEPNNGIALGRVQSASGSHTGGPNGSESPDIDKPWNFFGNTGMHQTTVAPTIISDDGNGNVVLNFSGWSVTWNGIADIPMGSGAHGINNDGQAILTCANTCENGDSFTLIYTATVPPNDPSNFGNVRYALRMEGAILVPGSIQASGGALANGLFGGTAANNYRLTSTEIQAAGVPDDSDYVNTGGYFDFSVTGLGGASATVVLPLSPTNIPADAVYRKYNAASGWFNFVEDANNTISSAKSVGGNCPPPGDAAYTNGLTAGNDCIQLVIEDNGPNDANSTAGAISDPGGLATAKATFTDTRTSGSSGCTLGNARAGDRMDLWLLVLSLIGLGFLRRRIH